MSEPFADPVASLARIRARLKAALLEAMSAAEAENAAAAITITAVAKTVPAERLIPLLEAGHRVFGENRVQETQAKWPALKARWPDVELRLIGPLQSNKARDAVALFDVIETVDREKIAAALADAQSRTGLRRRCLVQVNTGEEPQKAGVSPREADAFIASCRDAHALAVEGLMCIPPADEPPAPHFALLAKIARRNGLAALSMGMSEDFEIAAQLGATHLRVGTAIFGPRGGAPGAP